MTDWQPIGTAPDDEDVLLCLPRYGVSEDLHPFREMAVGRTGHDGFWYSSDDYSPQYRLHPPTHWMPLPKLPEFAQ